MHDLSYLPDTAVYQLAEEALREQLALRTLERDELRAENARLKAEIESLRRNRHMPSSPWANEEDAE